VGGNRHRKVARSGAEVDDRRGLIQAVLPQGRHIIDTVRARLPVVGGDELAVEVLGTGMGVLVKSPLLHRAILAHAGPEANDVTPRDVGVPATCLGPHRSGGLADDLEEAFHGQAAVTVPASTAEGSACRSARTAGQSRRNRSRGGGTS
jgi:hypothetical protein